jgi:hypothetical protein
MGGAGGENSGEWWRGESENGEGVVESRQEPSQALQFKTNKKNIQNLIWYGYKTDPIKIYLDVTFSKYGFQW